MSSSGRIWYVSGVFLVKRWRGSWRCGLRGRNGRDGDAGAGAGYGLTHTVLNKRHVYPRLRRAIRPSPFWRRRYRSAGRCDEERG